MKSWEIGDFCSAMEAALNALEYLIIKADEASDYDDQKEFYSLAFARDATMRRAKELLSEFSAASESDRTEK